MSSERSRHISVALAGAALVLGVVTGCGGRTTSIDTGDGGASSGGSGSGGNSSSSGGGSGSSGASSSSGSSGGGSGGNGSTSSGSSSGSTVGGCDVNVSEISCPDPQDIGYTCIGGSTPEQMYPGLTCTPTANPGGFCCTGNGASSSGSSSGAGSGGSGGSGGSSGGSDECTTDSSVACGTGLLGILCTDGAPPPATLACGAALSASGGDAYCCLQGSGTLGSCTVDPYVGACLPPTIGFQCTGTSTPADSDAALNCSVPVTDPNGIDLDYCCE